MIKQNNPSLLAQGMAALHDARTREYQYSYVRKIPPLPPQNCIEPGERIALGTYSQTWMKAKVRYINVAKTILMPYGRPTITDVARDYLTVKYPKRRIKREQGQLLHTHPPALYVQPGYYKDCVYLDIASCYWNVIRIVGWDVDLWPGRWIAYDQKPMDDFPQKDHKQCRNALHGCALPSRLLIFTNTGRHSIKTFNKLLNLQLHEVIACVQHSIARFAVSECHCHYFNTDGAIIPIRDAQRYIAYVNSWGLSVKTEHEGDPTIIKTAGSYKMGDYSTKRYHNTRPREIDNLQAFAWSEWLHKRIDIIAARRGIEPVNRVGGLWDSRKGPG